MWWTIGPLSKSHLFYNVEPVICGQISYAYLNMNYMGGLIFESLIIFLIMENVFVLEWLTE